MKLKKLNLSTDWLLKIPFKGIRILLFVALFFTLLGRVIEAQNWASRIDKLSTINASGKDETINSLKGQISQLRKEINSLKAQHTLLNSQVERLAKPGSAKCSNKSNKTQRARSLEELRRIQQLENLNL
ncbi:hypothetical protein ACE1CI_19955 [Aerosakkonemataceae cyanobacterium BLCC-F50]|uniref:Uncharacterized protein n=1 Tax=Floridaenema flaviceps BLCC-F50 TaxID=3153642 RepID=A0ABV4XWA3_9CYAN